MVPSGRFFNTFEETMVRSLSIFVVLVTLALSSSGQGEMQGLNILYNRQHYGGINLNSRGYGAFFVFGKNKDAFNIWQFTTDLTVLRHEKERKYFYPEQNTKGYFYGKEYGMLNLKLGVGRKHIISEKLRTNGIQLSYTVQGGGILGFLKPVYLEIIRSYEDSPGSFYLETERYNPDEHFIDNIYGRASALRGLGEMRFVPGGFVRAALNVEFSNYRDGLKGMEVGACMDAFPYRVPLMAESILQERDNGARNHQFFFSLYLQFFIGKKYNKE